MLNTTTLFLLVFVASLTGFSQNQESLWTDLPSQSYELTASYRGIPQHYRAVGLNENAFQEQLGECPAEAWPGSPGAGKMLVFPLPDGSNQRFLLVESPIMEAGLAQKFPEIKTYLGKGIDDPFASLRCNFSTQGFHAIIHTLEGTIYIDPYPALNQTVYFSYFKRDYQAVKSFAEGILPQDPSGGGSGPVMPAGSGQTLRIFRIAIATTGEYASFHGGTASSVMSAVVTTLNRVNSIYERELAIRFELVTHNDRLIYLNSSTDPYTNNDANALLSQNQMTIDTEIGSLNYDIGHVLSTGSGGLASTGVCRSNSKAFGTTGTNSPIGDPFDVDYVSHEIGHQLSADHIYNGRDSSCQGQRVAQSAYEPGSGSTIMGYAGICGSDNLQRNSDDYFNSHSYEQILNYISNGPGSNCGASIATGNTPPAIDPLFGNTTIPIMTPFELEGSASDADGDNISYCWEQYDRGPSGSPGSPAGDAPIFRSFRPSPSPIRIFPRLENILNNTTTIGEILPTYTRNLSFRLSARDNFASGGGVEYATTQFSVNAQAGPFKLVFPNSSTTVRIQTLNLKIPIIWNPANTELAPVSCDSVSIHLSVDGGYTFPHLLARSVPNTGMASVGFPLINTDSARIKVKARNNIFFTISEENFVIELVNVGLEPNLEKLTFQLGPHPVKEELHLQFSSPESGHLSFDLMDLNGRVLRTYEDDLRGANAISQILDVRALAQGMYVYRIRFADRVYGGKILILQ